MIVSFIKCLGTFILTCNIFDYVHDVFYLKFKLYFVTNLSHFKSEILYKLNFECCKLMQLFLLYRILIFWFSWYIICRSIHLG